MNNDIAKSEIRLQQAKRLAVEFLHIPIEPTQAGGMFVIAHPFFNTGIICDREGIFNAFEETERFKRYLDYFERSAIVPSSSIGRLLNHIRKPYVMTYLSFLMSRRIITLKECGNLLAERWSEIENISHDVNVKKSTVLRWIAAADKDRLMDKGERKKLKALPATATVYRGCRSQSAMRGLSWTLSEEKAWWFADRLSLLSGGKGKEGIVFRAQIKKEDIIGYLDNRGEQEVIVDYRKLLNVERVQRSDEAELVAAPDSSEKAKKSTSKYKVDVR